MVTDTRCSVFVYRFDRVFGHIRRDACKVKRGTCLAPRWIQNTWRAFCGHRRKSGRNSRATDGPSYANARASCTRSFRGYVVREKLLFYYSAVYVGCDFRRFAPSNVARTGAQGFPSYHEKRVLPNSHKRCCRFTPLNSAGPVCGAKVRAIVFDTGAQSVFAIESACPVTIGGSLATSSPLPAIE